MEKALLEWAVKNGINKEQIIFLNATPNRLMPEVFREVDLAVFPNRCEGGTNLVAMEAMASNIPCIISKNTGHTDIIKDRNCYPLEDQRQIHIPNEDTVDWGESSVEEIVVLMEDTYHKRKKLDTNSIRNSVLEHSWESSINKLLCHLY
jgi:glycosyltransferase involved in cell wall biosynthesis